MKLENQQSQADLKDLGFGSKVAMETRSRLLNRDGSFNVSRTGLSVLRSLSIYHYLLKMSWKSFFGITFSLYLGTNLLFALAFLLCGPGALHGVMGRTTTERFAEAFFFSVQTFTTIGYGRVNPLGLAANSLVAVEAIVGLMGFAVATGLVFARFSRPNAQILFSKHAIIAPYRGITAFEFRIINERSNQLLEVEVTVLFSRMEDNQGKRIRRFHELPLERKKVMFFPLNWTIVHPIDETSPLYGATQEDLAESNAEFLILLTGIDENFSQTVHTRSSYKYDEVIVGAKFGDMFQQSTDGHTSVDLRRIHDIEIL